MSHDPSSNPRSGHSDGEFRTTQSALASFLLYRGHSPEILPPSSADTRFHTFAFAETPDLLRAVAEYASDSPLMVDAREYERARTRIFAMLKDAQRGGER